MKFFKAIKNFIDYLTQEENAVKYEQPSVQEEETLERTIENPYVSQVRDWAIKKIDLLHEADRHRNAKALAAEFDEWINIPEEIEELDYLCIEDQNWTDEEELDVEEPTS
jgi:hypothetical protein